jgi:glycosyltransferase involved in cell wall biosynthesis
MKIAFLLDGIYEYASGSPRAVGGAERDQWRLARALVAAGWSAVVGVRGELKAGERRIIDGVEYVGINQGQVLWSWHRFLAEERPDWLLWECAYHLWGGLVGIAKLIGVNTIFHAGFDTDFEPRKALVWRPRWWPLYAWGLSRTDRIFVQHTGQLSGLRPRWQSKAYLLPKVCFFGDELGGKEIVTPHAEREKYVAWVAVLRQHKRPDLLIEIARKAPAIRFVVCGGPTDDYGKRIVDELRGTSNIEYLGHVAPEKAEQVIAGAAVFLSTSDKEGFPNTFTQAWSSGTPVVSLKIDPDHIIEEVGMGTVPENVDSAIADINSLVTSPQRREEIAMRARKFVVENYSASAVVSLFERALGGVH